MIGFLANKFELSRETSGSNLRAMEGMRGFAVILVFLTHYCTLISPWLGGSPTMAAVASAIHAVGNTGVDLFFVLSGYLIYKTLISREQNFFTFMGRRVRRIYPAFLVVFAVYCALSLALPRESSIPADAPWLYLAQNLLLLPGLFPIKPMITVAWSLSYEIFFYLCLPIIIAVMRMRGWRASSRIVFIGAAAIVLGACSAVFELGFMRLIMFMAGMLVHEALESREVRSPSAAVAACVLVAGLAGSLLPANGYVKIAILFASFFLVCMNCFLRPQDGLGRAFCWTPLRWLGNMSYSYYLLHGLTLKVLFTLLPHSDALVRHGVLLFVLLLPVFFAATLCSSAGLFLLVERPLSLRAGGRPSTAGRQPAFDGAYKAEKETPVSNA